MRPKRSQLLLYVKSSLHSSTVLYSRLQDLTKKDTSMSSWRAVDSLNKNHNVLSNFQERKPGYHIFLNEIDPNFAHHQSRWLTMTDESRALWDPLWEYVFDDYDVEDEKRRRLLGRKEPEKKDKAAFAFFSEKNHDEEYEASSRSKKAAHKSRKKVYQAEREPDDYSWGWGGAEQPEERQNDRTSCHHPWRRSKSSARDGNTSYDTDQASESAWGLVGRHETEKKDAETLKPRILKKASSDKATTKDETIEKNRKGPLKKLFKRSYRKEEPQLNANKEPRSTKAVTFTNAESRQERRPARSRTGQSKTDSRTGRSTTQQSKNDESEATFVDMLFDVAGTLDPWTSESESDSDTRTENTDDRTEQTDDRTTDEMAVGRDTEELPRTTSAFTEIRLQHTPARDPPPEEEPSAQQGISSQKSTQVSASSQNIVSIPAVELHETAILQPVALERTSRTIGDKVDECWQFPPQDESASRDHARDTASPEFGLKEKVSRDSFPSDEYFRKSNKILQSVAELDAAEFYEAPKGLKRLVCCGSKKSAQRDTEENGENRMREEMSDMLPRSRMISDQQTSIVGKKSDAEDDILGVPSDRFLKAKGPQSLYAYDYKSNQNMDVAYKHFNQHYRAAIDCRTHTELPLVESLTGDRVIVQVEVCE